MTLMELMVASALTVVVMTSSFMLVRTGHSAWSAHQDDLEPLSSAHAAIRHVVRHIRQAQAVTAFDPAGSIALAMPSGDTLVWQYDSGNDQVLFGVGSANSVLADGITQWSLAAYQADGATPAADPSEIQLVHCNAEVVLPRGAGQVRTISSWAWMRSW